jgi:hypothetical protein
VQKILRPSTCQPDSVRVARVAGRVRSCAGSLTAVAITDRSATISRSVAAAASVRRASAAATASSHWRTMLRRTAMCMLTPIATDASPRARRLAATSRSWTDDTPMPPSAAGIGAANRPASRSAAMLPCG